MVGNIKLAKKQGLDPNAKFWSVIFLHCNINKDVIENLTLKEAKKEIAALKRKVCLNWAQIMYSPNPVLFPKVKGQNYHLKDH